MAKRNVRNEEENEAGSGEETGRGGGGACVYVNGKRYELPEGRGGMTLLEFLRGRQLKH